MIEITTRKPSLQKSRQEGDADLFCKKSAGISSLQSNAASNRQHAEDTMGATGEFMRLAVMVVTGI
jgi:hypothetical protein